MKFLSFFVTLIIISCLFTACTKDEIRLSFETDVSTDFAVDVDNSMLNNARVDGVLASYTILGGQSIPVGTATIGLTTVNGLQKLYINVNTSATDWVAGTTHIYAGLYDDIPLSSGGNPKNGHFLFGSANDIPVDDILGGLNYGNYPQSFTYYIPLEELDTYLVEDPASSEPPMNCFTLLVHIEAYEIDYIADPSTSLIATIPLSALLTLE